MKEMRANGVFALLTSIHTFVFAGSNHFGITIIKRLFGPKRNSNKNLVTKNLYLEIQNNVKPKNVVSKLGFQENTMV